MGIFFDLFKNNNKSIILKTAKEKEIERQNEIKKRTCPNCGQDPITGNRIGFSTTDYKFVYVTCGHCDTDYKYKK